MTQSREIALTRQALRRGRALYVLAAIASFLLSVFLWFTGSREQGLFVGLWVPSILALGALLTNAPHTRVER